MYAEIKDIPTSGWHKDSVHTFTSDSLTDLPEVIKIGFDLRNKSDYYYRNLWLFVEINIPGQESPIIDTLDHLLMTADGFWNEGVEGAAIKESVAYYPYAIKNPPAGVYTLKVQQGMRDTVLKDIISIGARIEKVNP